MNEWISVKDRLPEIKDKSKYSESEDVLVLDDFMYVGYLIYYPIEGYRTKEEYCWSDRSTGCGCCSNGINPTHWMPLPEPPKD